MLLIQQKKYMIQSKEYTVINFVNKEYIYNFSAAMNPDNIIEGYFQSSNTLDRMILENYKSLNGRHNDKVSSKKLFDNLVKFNEKFEEINKLITGINETSLYERFNSMIGSNKLKSEAFQINLIFGWNLCDGFANSIDGQIHINVAVDKFLDFDYTQETVDNIESLIIHEMAHGYRQLEQYESKDVRLSNMIIEEGLACAYCLELYKPERFISNTVMPNGIEIIPKATLEEHLDKYKFNYNRKGDSYTRKLVFLGHKIQGIPSGMGYYYGLISILNLMVYKKMKIEELIAMPCESLKSLLDGFEELDLDYERLFSLWRQFDAET